MTSPQFNPGGQNIGLPGGYPSMTPPMGPPPVGQMPGRPPSGVPSMRPPTVGQTPIGPPSGPPPMGPPTGQMPMGAPPSFSPQIQTWRQGSSGINSCLFRYTYIWEYSGNEFWFYPIAVGRDQIIGYRWSRRRNRWNFRTISRSNIRSYQCFR